MNKEELHKDLVPYIQKNESFLMVRHPLVYSVPYFPAENFWLNKQYEAKSKMCKELLEQKDYTGYICLHEKPWRLEAFKNIKSKLNIQLHYELLHDIWIGSENIWQNKKDWLKLLSKDLNHRSYFMSEEDIMKLNGFSDTLTIYRGYETGGDKFGYSYTTDMNRARWFSKRFGKAGKVVTRTIKKEDIFAYTDERSESEVIILKPKK